ncbi:MAG TPA: hypothetical protein VGE74_22630 [Gemmata sp.]
MKPDRSEIDRLHDDGNPHTDEPLTAADSADAAELAEYDAETVRLVMEAEREVGEIERNYESLKKAASDSKKQMEARVSQLRQLIRDREAQRGAKPEPSLLDMLTEAAPAKWRELPVDALKIDRGILNHLSFEGIANLGQLYDEITSFNPAEGTPYSLALGDVAEIRMAIQELIDAEKPAPVAIPEDLWRAYPVENWTRFGLTEKDVEKLAAGEIKRETGRSPIVTVGDLSDFSKPSANGWTRKLADIKGIGTAGADRISDGETKFWGWWNGGGEREFARERGLIGGDATTTRVDREGSGGGDPCQTTGGVEHETLDHDTRTRGI